MGFQLGISRRPKQEKDRPFATMLMKVCLLVSFLMVGTFAKRPLDRLREKFEDIAEIAEKVPYFVANDCEDVPTDPNNFKVGLMNLCEDAEREDVICVCKPKKKCDMMDSLFSNSPQERSSFKEMLMEMLKDKTNWPLLNYEKKCRICRMRWTRCKDDDENCPEEKEDEDEACQDLSIKALLGGRRPNRFNRNRFN